MAPSFPALALNQSIAINFTGGIFLGLYLISAAFANRWLIFTDDGWNFRKKIHWLTLASTNITIVLVVVTMGFTVATSMEQAAWVEQGKPNSEYAEPAWRGTTKCAASGVIVLLADIVLMHRLWITHMRKMAVMWFPIFLWVGGLVCMILEIFLQIEHVHHPDFGPYRWAKVNMDVGPGIVFLPFLASTIVLNAYCTGLLIWQVWRRVNHVGRSSSRQLQILVRILMESGILYFVMSIAHFVSYFGHDNFSVHMNGTLHTIVIGIAYDLIIIRVGQNRTEEDHTLTNGKLTTFQVADISREISDTSTGSMLTDDEVRRDKFGAV